MLSIRQLHLTARGANALEDADIKTIGQLVEKSRNGLSQIRAIGQTTESDIATALLALSRSIRGNEIDWMRYATIRGFTVIPPADTKIEPGDVPTLLPQVLLAAVKSSFDSPRIQLFTNLFLGQNRAAETTTELARRWGVTTKYVLLMKKEVLTALQGALFFADYTNCFFRFHPVFAERLQRLKGRLGDANGRALSQADWLHLLSQSINFSPIDERRLRSLLFALLRYQIVFRKSQRYRPILLPAARNASAFKRAVVKLDQLTRLAGPSGISEKRILRGLRLENGRGPQPSELPVLASAIPDLEFETSSRSYRSAKPSRPRMTDRIEKTLRKKKKPMHLCEIFAELNAISEGKAKKRTPHHISQLMGDDDRFKPIGRTGLWALSSWSVETRKITDIAANILSVSGKPLAVSELFSRILAKRPLKQATVGRLLLDDPRFRRTAPGFWTLATRQKGPRRVA